MKCLSVTRNRKMFGPIFSTIQSYLFFSHCNRGSKFPCRSVPFMDQPILGSQRHIIAILWPEMKKDPFLLESHPIPMAIYLTLSQNTTDLLLHTAFFHGGCIMGFFWLPRCCTAGFQQGCTPDYVGHALYTGLGTWRTSALLSVLYVGLADGW